MTIDGWSRGEICSKPRAVREFSRRPRPAMRSPARSMTAQPA